MPKPPCPNRRFFYDGAKIPVSSVQRVGLAFRQPESGVPLAPAGKNNFGARVGNGWAAPPALNAWSCPRMIRRWRWRRTLFCNNAERPHPNMVLRAGELVTLAGYFGKNGGRRPLAVKKKNGASVFDHAGGRLFAGNADLHLKKWGGGGGGGGRRHWSMAARVDVGPDFPLNVSRENGRARVVHIGGCRRRRPKPNPASRREPIAE